MSRLIRLDWTLNRTACKKALGQHIFVGRPPVIDWGAGRFCKPLNVFGAFVPPGRGSNYKPGIDAEVFGWYPSDFSSLNAP